MRDTETITYPGGLLDGMIGWENGSLDPDEEIDLMQHLVDTGLAWSLQGTYGRAAADMIARGLVTQPADADECPHDCPCRSGQWPADGEGDDPE